jgi:hypothetical protein
MIDQILNDILLNPGQLAKTILIIFTVGVFIYIIILSILQARQVRLLQQKVQTDADGFVRFMTYLYIFLQILLFVFAFLFL